MLLCSFIQSCVHHQIPGPGTSVGTSAKNKIFPSVMSHTVLGLAVVSHDTHNRLSLSSAVKEMTRVIRAHGVGWAWQDLDPTQD